MILMKNDSKSLKILIADTSLMGWLWLLLLWCLFRKR